MVYEANFNDTMKTLLLVLAVLPLLSAMNIDCGGKPFHCVNATHFMICVDVGGGLSTTVDDFVIPCPPPTECRSYHHFECELLPPDTATRGEEAMEILSVDSMSPKTAEEEHLELSTLITTQDPVTDPAVVPLKSGLVNETNVSVSGIDFSQFQPTVNLLDTTTSKLGKSVSKLSTLNTTQDSVTATTVVPLQSDLVNETILVVSGKDFSQFQPTVNPLETTMLKLGQSASELSTLNTTLESVTYTTVVPLQSGLANESTLVLSGTNISQFKPTVNPLDDRTSVLGESASETSTLNTTEESATDTTNVPLQYDLVNETTLVVSRMDVSQLEPTVNQLNITISVLEDSASEIDNEHFITTGTPLIKVNDSFTMLDTNSTQSHELLTDMILNSTSETEVMKKLASITESPQIGLALPNSIRYVDTNHNTLKNLELSTLITTQDPVTDPAVVPLQSGLVNETNVSVSGIDFSQFQPTVNLLDTITSKYTSETEVLKKMASITESPQIGPTLPNSISYDDTNHNKMKNTNKVQIDDINLHQEWRTSLNNATGLKGLTQIDTTSTDYNSEYNDTDTVVVKTTHTKISGIDDFVNSEFTSTSFPSESPYKTKIIVTKEEQPDLMTTYDTTTTSSQHQNKKATTKLTSFKVEATTSPELLNAETLEITTSIVTEAPGLEILSTVNQETRNVLRGTTLVPTYTQNVKEFDLEATTTFNESQITYSQNLPTVQVYDELEQNKTQKQLSESSISADIATTLRTQNEYRDPDFLDYVTVNYLQDSRLFKVLNESTTVSNNINTEDDIGKSKSANKVNFGNEEYFNPLRNKTTDNYLRQSYITSPITTQANILESESQLTNESDKLQSLATTAAHIAHEKHPSTKPDILVNITTSELANGKSFENTTNTDTEPPAPEGLSTTYHELGTVLRATTTMPTSTENDKNYTLEATRTFSDPEITCCQNLPTMPTSSAPEKYKTETSLSESAINADIITTLRTDNEYWESVLLDYGTANHLQDSRLFKVPNESTTVSNDINTEEDTSKPKSANKVNIADEDYFNTVQNKITDSSSSQISIISPITTQTNILQLTNATDKLQSLTTTAAHIAEELQLSTEPDITLHSVHVAIKNAKSFKITTNTGTESAATESLSPIYPGLGTVFRARNSIETYNNKNFTLEVTRTSNYSDITRSQNISTMPASSAPEKYITETPVSESAIIAEMATTLSTQKESDSIVLDHATVVHLQDSRRTLVVTETTTISNDLYTKNYTMKHTSADKDNYENKDYLNIVQNKSTGSFTPSPITIQSKIRLKNRKLRDEAEKMQTLTITDARIVEHIQPSAKLKLTVNNAKFDEDIVSTSSSNETDRSKIYKNTLYDINGTLIKENNVIHTSMTDSMTVVTTPSASIAVSEIIAETDTLNNAIKISTPKSNETIINLPQTIHTSTESTERLHENMQNGTVQSNDENNIIHKNGTVLQSVNFTKERTIFSSDINHDVTPVTETNEEEFSAITFTETGESANIANQSKTFSNTSVKTSEYILITGETENWDIKEPDVTNNINEPRKGDLVTEIKHDNNNTSILPSSDLTEWKRISNDTYINKSVVATQSNTTVNTKYNEAKNSPRKSANSVLDESIFMKSERSLKFYNTSLISQSTQSEKEVIVVPMESKTKNIILDAIEYRDKNKTNDDLSSNSKEQVNSYTGSSLSPSAKREIGTITAVVTNGIVKIYDNYNTDYTLSTSPSQIENPIMDFLNETNMSLESRQVSGVSVTDKILPILNRNETANSRSHIENLKTSMYLLSTPASNQWWTEDTYSNTSAINNTINVPETHIVTDKDVSEVSITLDRPKQMRENSETKFNVMEKKPITASDKLVFTNKPDKNRITDKNSHKNAVDLESIEKNNNPTVHTSRTDDLRLTTEHYKGKDEALFQDKKYNQSSNTIVITERAILLSPSSPPVLSATGRSGYSMITPDMFLESTLEDIRKETLATNENTAIISETVISINNDHPQTTPPTFTVTKSSIVKQTYKNNIFNVPTETYAVNELQGNRDIIYPLDTTDDTRIGKAPKLDSYSTRIEGTTMKYQALASQTESAIHTIQKDPEQKTQPAFASSKIFAEPIQPVVSNTIELNSNTGTTQKLSSSAKTQFEQSGATYIKQNIALTQNKDKKSKTTSSTTLNNTLKQITSTVPILETVAEATPYYKSSTVTEITDTELNLSHLGADNAKITIPTLLSSINSPTTTEPIDIIQNSMPVVATHKRSEILDEKLTHSTIKATDILIKVGLKLTTLTTTESSFYSGNIASAEVVTALGAGTTPTTPNKDAMTISETTVPVSASTSNTPVSPSTSSDRMYPSIGSTPVSASTSSAPASPSTSEPILLTPSRSTVLATPSIRSVTSSRSVPVPTTTSNIPISPVTSTTQAYLATKSPPLSSGSSAATKNAAQSIGPTAFSCARRPTGRYSEDDDCRKFYVCSGIPRPIIGLCPANTVFSEITKQCTRNLSHCIRRNEFKCATAGRFSDFTRTNVYYICVKKGDHFLRYKLQCQKGYHLNKTVHCSKIPEPTPAPTSSVSSDVSSSLSAAEEKPLQRKSRVINREIFECKEEGRFADPYDCRGYYVCRRVDSAEGYHRKRKTCDDDEIFHREKKKCVDSSSNQCRICDLISPNIYYVFVRKQGYLLRFKLQCQSGYSLNKSTVRCNKEESSPSGLVGRQAPTSGEHFRCIAQGKYRDPRDCRRYYVCKRKDKNRFKQKRKKCHRDEVFNEDKQKCVDAGSIHCH